MKKIIKLNIVLVIMSLLLIFSACGTTSSGTESSEIIVESSETKEAEQIKQQAKQQTKTISTVKGDIEVPINPQRVIATYGMGDVIALGVKPVVTYDATGKAYEKEVSDLPLYSDFEAEEIMTYNPDLILVVSDEQYDEVSKIAPTVFVPFTELSMEERITFLGEVLGKEAEAEKILTDFNNKIVDAQKVLKEKEIYTKTFSLFEYGNNGSIWVYGDKWGRGGDLVYSHLGLSAPEIIQNEIIAKDQYRELSMEVLEDYAGDYIIFSGELNDLATNPVWNSLSAVQSEQIIFIDFTLFYDIDIYSSNVQLDYLMDKLLAE